MNTRTMTLLLTALALTAAGPIVSQAQDTSAQQAKQDAAEVKSAAAREGRANDRLGNDPNLNNDETPRRNNGAGATDRIADLHRSHPHAAARCHDGFFTTTRNRSRACSRHGGIDVWLTG